MEARSGLRAQEVLHVVVVSLAQQLHEAKDLDGHLRRRRREIGRDRGGDGARSGRRAAEMRGDGTRSGEMGRRQLGRDRAGGDRGRSHRHVERGEGA